MNQPVFAQAVQLKWAWASGSLCRAGQSRPPVIWLQWTVSRVGVSYLGLSNTKITLPKQLQKLQCRRSLCTSWGHGAGWHSPKDIWGLICLMEGQRWSEPWRPAYWPGVGWFQANPPIPLGWASPSRDSHLLAYYVLSRMINSLYALTHLILTTNLCIIRCDHWWENQGQEGAMPKVTRSKRGPARTPGPGAQRRLPCWSTWPSLCLPQLFPWRVIGNNWNCHWK